MPPRRAPSQGRTGLTPTAPGPVHPPQTQVGGAASVVVVVVDDAASQHAPPTRQPVQVGRQPGSNGRGQHQSRGAQPRPTVLSHAQTASIRRNSGEPKSSFQVMNDRHLRSWRLFRQRAKPLDVPVYTAYTTPQFPSFLHPPIELASRRQTHRQHRATARGHDGPVCHWGSDDRGVVVSRTALVKASLMSSGVSSSAPTRVTSTGCRSWSSGF